MSQSVGIPRICVATRWQFQLKLLVLQTLSDATGLRTSTARAGIKNMPRARVHVIPTSAPDDLDGLRSLIDTGELVPTKV